MEDENQHNQIRKNESVKKIRMMDNPGEENIDKNYMMCQQHKRKIEFVCLAEICFSQKFFCPKCNHNHQQHGKHVLTIDSYLQNMMEREQELCQQRKQMINERVQQMKKIVQKISKSIDSYQENELEDIQRQFDEVNLRCSEDKYKFLKDFCTPSYDTTTLFQVPLFNREMNYCKIQDTAQNMLHLIERKEYNLQNLIGILIRQDNLFEIVEKEERLRHQSQQLNAHQNNIGMNNINNNQQNNQNPQQNQDNLLENQNRNNNQDLINNNSQAENQGNQFQNIGEAQNADQDDSQEELEITFDDDDGEEGEEYIGEGEEIINHGDEEDEWTSDSSMSSDLENGRRITSLLKLSRNVIVFSNIKTVYYYNFISRKVVNQAEFNSNVFINKLVKLSQNRIAVLVHKEFIDEMIVPGLVTFQIYFEIYILEQTQKGLKKYRIFAEKRGYEVRDIFEIKNSPFLAIVQEEIGIAILNTRNGKIISQYQCDLEEAVPFEGIYSCTMLNNIQIDDVLYKHLIAINLIDGSYGLWDFMNNKYIMKKRFSNNIGLNYKFSTAVRIKEAFNTHIEKKNIYQQNNQNNDSNSKKKYEMLDESVYDKQQYLIVIQGDRNETYMQRDYDGFLDVKMHHRLMDQFDLFYNQSAIPFYHNNCIFFYDFIQQKRLKTIPLNTKFNQSAYIMQNQQLQNNLQNNQNNGRQSIFSLPNQNQQQQNDESSQINRIIHNLQNASNNNRSNQQINQNQQTHENNDLSNSNLKSQKKKDKQNQIKSFDEEEIQSSKSSKEKMQSQSSSLRSSKSKKREIKGSSSKQNPPQQLPLTFSQMWDQSLLQFQSNQRNIQPIQFFQNNQQQQQNNSNPINITHLINSNNQQRPIDILSHIEFGNPSSYRNIPIELPSLPEQNEILQINNFKLFDICPIGIINHYEFIVVIFPNGTIQYIK